MQWLERTELLLSKKKLEKLTSANVLVIGLGGVGSYAVEFLVRSGIGSMTIIDGDIVDTTNRNRQLPALFSTIGISKAKVLADRIKDINPDINLTVIEEFLNPERMEDIVKNGGYNFALDCIDSMTPKIELIIACKRNKVKFISSMGAGGKFTPSMVQITDIYETHDCQFARELKKRLKKNGIRWGVKVVFSPEPVSKSALKLTDGTNYKKSFYGTISYMPALFGLHMAYYAIERLTSKQ
jgi:tRNA threonylcarbamoyladenosine dehydratase